MHPPDPGAWTAPDRLAGDEPARAERTGLASYGMARERGG